MTGQDGAEIVASSLTKGFGTRPNVLDGVEMTGRGGGLVLVLGEPASGKTTLVRCLTGVYRPRAGAVRYRMGAAGQVDLTDTDTRTVAWMRAHYIASFDDLVAAAPRLPAAAVISRSAGCDRAAAAAALDRVGAGDLATVAVGELRSNQRLTVGLVAALSAHRPFVVLDEPERFVPAAVLAPWLQHLARRGAAVIATAAPDSALVPTAQAVGRLEKGRMQWQTR